MLSSSLESMGRSKNRQELVTMTMHCQNDMTEYLSVLEGRANSQDCALSVLNAYDVFSIGAVLVWTFLQRRGQSDRPADEITEDPWVQLCQDLLLAVSHRFRAMSSFRKVLRAFVAAARSAVNQSDAVAQISDSEAPVPQCVSSIIQDGLDLLKEPA